MSVDIIIIMEYCKYGSLLRFIRNNRSGFVNQINGDTIDPKIMTPNKEILLHVTNTNTSNLQLDAQLVTNSGYIPFSTASNGDDMNRIGNNFLLSSMPNWMAISCS